MRNILVDEARRKHRLRRNAGKPPAELSVALTAATTIDLLDLIALDQALTALATEHERPDLVAAPDESRVTRLSRGCQPGRGLAACFSAAS